MAATQTPGFYELVHGQVEISLATSESHDTSHIIHAFFLYTLDGKLLYCHGASDSLQTELRLWFDGIPCLSQSQSYFPKLWHK